MPYTVAMSFQKFRDNTVDLPADDTSRARLSRDYLYSQVRSLAASTVMSGSTLSFGSFARRTKTRPLDDIDCFASVRCGDTTQSYLSGGYTYNLTAPPTARLYEYSDAHGNVNSTRILNAVKTAMQSIPQYRHSDIGRDGSAVVLNLKSYDWSFDIVPACAVANSAGETTHYLIPDGSARWKKTNSRIDAQRTTDANQKHSGHFLPAVRLLKYWNRRTYKPRLPSYYFETLLTNRALTSGAYPSLTGAVEDLLYGLSETIMRTCDDPKGHEPALDRAVDYDTKSRCQKAAADAWIDSRRALGFEKDGNNKEAIGLWRAIFGPEFPDYG